MPSRKTKLFGSIKTLTSSKFSTLSVATRLRIELELIAQAGAASAQNAQAQPSRDFFTLERLADLLDRLRESLAP